MNSLINIPLKKEEIMQALQKALQNKLIDNLRDRHPNVSLDSKLRGYIGEYAFLKWAKEYDIYFKSTNKIDNTSGMDIDLLFQGQNTKLQIELKTSLIPDADETLEEFMNKRDIKIIQRGNQTIEEIKGDIHVQLAFKQLRIRKDEWLKKQPINLNTTIEEIYHKIAAYRYQNDTFIIAWIDKPTLIKQLKQKPSHLQKWKYGQRSFWSCNLSKDAKKPIELIKFLNKL